MEEIHPAEKNAEDLSGGPRPLADILADLRKPIPARLLETKRIQGNDITFCPWHRVQKILNHYTRGFVTYEVRERTLTEQHIMLTVRITIHAQEGLFYNDGTGIDTELEDVGWGDPQSRAESMAFRRAAARFGLGLDLYEKERQ